MTCYSSAIIFGSLCRTSIRYSWAAVCLTLALFSSGCCGPIGCGCSDRGCYDCDGTASNPIPYGPLDGIRNLKRSLICGGGGCGETYVGEWISTPPDCCDPCCGDQWVGGATPCRPFCWEPGSLMGCLNFYGERFCSGAESSAPCGCGDVCDDCCGYEGEYYDDGYYEGEYFDDGVFTGGGSSCGCASCSAKNSGSSRFARNVPPISSRTTSQARRDPRVQQIRR